MIPSRNSRIESRMFIPATVVGVVAFVASGLYLWVNVGVLS